MPRSSHRESKVDSSGECSQTLAAQSAYCMTDLCVVWPARVATISLQSSQWPSDSPLAPNHKVIFRWSQNNLNIVEPEYALLPLGNIIRTYNIVHYSIHCYYFI